MEKDIIVSEMAYKDRMRVEEEKKIEEENENNTTSTTSTSSPLWRPAKIKSQQEMEEADVESELEALGEIKKEELC